MPHLHEDEARRPTGLIFMQAKGRKRLKVPLQSEGGIDEERLIIVGVEDEVVAELHLGTNGEMLCGVVPELGLREDDEHAVAVGLHAAPEVYKARESTLLIGEGGAPDTRQLSTIVSIINIVALKEALIHQLHAPGGGEVGIVAVVGSTHEGCLLVASNVGAETAVVLDMGSEAFFADIELARDLGIGSKRFLAAEVEVDEIEPRSPGSALNCSSVRVTF